MHPPDFLEICDYLDWFVHIFKYVTQEKLWDVLSLAMKQMTLSYRKFVKKYQSLSNVCPTEK